MPITCFGSCWIDVYSDEQTDIYVDYCSITQVGKYKKAWVRFVYAENQQTVQSEDYDETKQLTYFDCALKSMNVVDVIYYAPEPESKVISRASAKFKSSDLRDIVPDSLGEIQFEAVCKAKSRK